MQYNISSKFQSLAKKENSYLGKLAFQKMSVQDYKNDYKEGNPAVYVGTYSKYNDGNLFGMWVDLVKCGDYDTFMEVCHNLHADEEDPELMYQDYECFPKAWYSESGIDEDTFDKIIEYAELDEDDREAFEEFTDSFGNDSFDSFKERYMGKWDSEKDFAEHIVDECYNLDDMMGHLASYFDYDAYARDLFIDDFYFTDGYVFRR
jgi:antirestriction protein